MHENTRAEEHLNAEKEKKTALKFRNPTIGYKYMTLFIGMFFELCFRNATSNVHLNFKLISLGVWCKEMQNESTYMGGHLCLDMTII